MRWSISKWIDKWLFGSFRFSRNYEYEFSQFERTAKDLKSQIEVKNNNGYIDIRIKGQVKAVRINGHRIDIKPRL